MSTGEINYGEAGQTVASFQRGITTAEPFEQVIAGLRKGVDAAGLWILHEIDPQAVLRRGGHSIGAGRQILFFHPDLMIRLLEADQAALLEVQLKFAVLELADGSVSVRWLDPAGAFWPLSQFVAGQACNGACRDMRTHRDSSNGSGSRLRVCIPLSTVPDRSGEGGRPCTKSKSF